MNDELKVPIVEEEISVGKRRYDTGSVRVSTEVHTEEVIARETLERRTARVERMPIDREIDCEPQIREENGVLIVPVVEERLIIQKRLVLVEELHIFRETTSVPAEVPVTRRTMRAIIERDGQVEPSGDEKSDG